MGGFWLVVGMTIGALLWPCKWDPAIIIKEHFEKEKRRS